MYLRVYQFRDLRAGETTVKFHHFTNCCFRLHLLRKRRIRSIYARFTVHAIDLLIVILASQHSKDKRTVYKMPMKEINIA